MHKLDERMLLLTPSKQILVMYPLDVVKTRVQLQTGKAGPDGYTGMVDCFQKIVRNEG